MRKTLSMPGIGKASRPAILPDAANPLRPTLASDTGKEGGDPAAIERPTLMRPRREGGRNPIQNIAGMGAPNMNGVANRNLGSPGSTSAQPPGRPELTPDMLKLFDPNSQTFNAPGLLAGDINAANQAELDAFNQSQGFMGQAAGALGSGAAGQKKAGEDAAALMQQQANLLMQEFKQFRDSSLQRLQDQTMAAESDAAGGISRAMQNEMARIDADQSLTPDMKRALKDQVKTGYVQQAHSQLANYANNAMALEAQTRLGFGGQTVQAGQAASAMMQAGQQMKLASIESANAYEAQGYLTLAQLARNPQSTYGYFDALTQITLFDQSASVDLHGFKPFEGGGNFFQMDPNPNAGKWYPLNNMDTAMGKGVNPSLPSIQGM